MTKKVKKAIIPAAGLNSRMYPFTKIQSKLLVPILNKPIIEYLIEELAHSGIEEIIIVSNHVPILRQFLEENEPLKKLLKKMGKTELISKISHLDFGKKIDIIPQNLPMGWMHEVLHAEEHLKDAPFAVLFSDVLYKYTIPPTRQLIDLFQKKNKNINALCRFILKPDIFKIIENEKYELGQDIVDIDVFNKLKEKNDLELYSIKGDFFNIGDPLSFLKTNTIFGIKDPEIGQEYKKFLKEQLK